MGGAAHAPDVVVIGGGPAGSVAATLLADAGHRVLVLERERFPRYHIGESLLSATLPILDAIGATPAIERHGFLRKPGGTFLWGRQREPWSFWFREDPGGRPHAFHVVPEDDGGTGGDVPERLERQRRGGREHDRRLARSLHRHIHGRRL